MDLKEYTYELASRAVANNAFVAFLCGYPPYTLPDREGFLTTDRSGVLSCGIYALYKSDSSIKALFEKALLHLMQGSAYELMSAFEYVWRCKVSEWRGSAPFSLSPECSAALKQSLDSRKAELKQYRDLPEFGGGLPGGAWDYVRNAEDLIERDHGRSLWD